MSGIAYWELIADKLRAKGWSVGWVKMAAPGGPGLWQADAHRDDGRRFISRAEVLTVAFLELEKMIDGYSPEV